MSGGIVVVGGGFAGVWAAAAASAVRADEGPLARDLPVTVISPSDDLVIRPRLYEADPGRMRVPLHGVLSPIGVRHVRATVTGISAGPSASAGGSVDLTRRGAPPGTMRYDRLVLTSGSQARTPSVPGAAHLFSIDTIAAAIRLDRHLHGLSARPRTAARDTVVVVGAGFAGIELACTLPARLRRTAPGARMRVILAEHSSVVGPALGPGPRPVITAALAEAGVEVRLDRRLVRVSADAAEFSDGSVIGTCTTIWTAGMRASSLTGSLEAERDGLGRLVVDEFLRVPAAGQVFAAGDTAAALTPDGYPVMQSCQHAIPLGKFGGHNAMSDLLGRPLEPFDPGPYITCLDLGEDVAVVTSGWDRDVRLTGARAKAMKKAICESYIYPPAHDATALLAIAKRRPHPAVVA